MSLDSGRYDSIIQETDSFEEFQEKSGLSNDEAFDVLLGRLEELKKREEA